MSLRAKIYLIVGATLLVAVAVVFMVSQTVFMRGFESVEETEAEDQIKRAQAAVTWNVKELGVALKGYRSDEDILEFLQTRNPANVESELAESFFAGVKANALAIFDRNGDLLGAAGSIWRSRSSPRFPTGLESYLAPKEV